MRVVAVSACLIGKECRYDGSNNLDNTLLSLLKDDKIVEFCPEDFAFGSPRPTMDLVELDGDIVAISNKTKENLSLPIERYAREFFDTHRDIELYIGKDRSPSCGVCSAKIYDKEKNLISIQGTGLMSKEAKKRDIECIDATNYTKEKLI